MTTVNEPFLRTGHSTIWTGTEMIIWGGGNTNTGGRYNPTTDSWLAIDTTYAPSSRYSHSAVWTGSEMIIWGGLGGANWPIARGSSYDPVGGSWAPLSDAPTHVAHSPAVWTG